jgi:ABC-type transport system substrate-binding protein
MKGFDPVKADEEISHVCVINVYDQLYQHHHLKRPLELEPCLAAAMPEVSADGLTYTIRLKPGVFYADDPCFPGGKGREVVASDCVFCLLRLMDGHVDSPGTWTLEERIVGLDVFHEASLKAPKRLDRGSYGTEVVGREGEARVPKGQPSENTFTYPAVPGLAAPDPHTFVIRLTKPYWELEWVLAMAYFSIYPPEAVAYYGKAFRDHPVTSGPYLVQEYKRGQRMVLVRNPRYRDDFYPTEGMPEDVENGRLALAGQRLPLNDRVIATVFKETQPMWLYFESGYLDRTGIPKDNFDAAVDPLTKQPRGVLRERGIVLERDPKQEIIYDCFNFDDPVVGAKAGEKGRALRRAMSLALDAEWSRTHLYNDRVTRIDGPIIPAYAEYDPAFRNPWVRGKDESMEQARDRARKILADAGMAGGAGVPAIYYDVGDDSTEEQFFMLFKENMARIGLDLRPYTATWQEQIMRQREAKFQMTGLAWGADYPAAQNFLQLFYGPFRAPNSNSSNYANPEYDALYERALALPPGPERTAIYRKMQQIVVDDCVWIFRYAREQWTLRQPWLEGFRYNDIVLKSYKYSHVKVPDRPRLVAAWNPVRWAPTLIALAVVALLVTATLLAARRQVKGW